MAERAKEDQLEYSVATLPPTLRHRQLAFLVVGVTLIAFGAMAPFSTMPLLRIDSFLPTVLAIVFVTDLVTAVLLFAQFSATGSRALLSLASGYLFSSLIVIGYALAFPGAFAPANPLGVGPFSASWLFVIWRLGFLVGTVGYISLTGEKYTKVENHLSARRAICWSVAVTIGLVCTIIWSVTEGDRFIPPLVGNSGAITPLGQYLTALITLVNVFALYLLWTRGRSVLDLWLMVAFCALTVESVIVVLALTPRFSVAWYSNRLVSLFVSKVVLIVLLSETVRLQAGLSVANRSLQRERENKITAAGAVVAAIAHEVGQPLAAIIINAAVGRRFLDRASPDIAEAKNLFDQIEHAGSLANEVFDNFLGLLRGGTKEHQPLDMNALVLEAIDLLRNQLEDHDIVVDTMLASDLPIIQGNRGQLREVILNLAQNSIEAMAAITRPRILSIVTSRRSADSIIISLQDTGPGVDPDKLTIIFIPFVTTKAEGTGLGLPICTMIIEQHGGGLSVTSDLPEGARFEITLPTSGDR